MIGLALDLATRGAAWLATYLVHSTVLLGSALAVTRFHPALPEVHVNRLWKGAALAGLVTATLASAGGMRPLLGTLEVPAVERARHVIKETRVVRAGSTGEAPRRTVRREERIVRPAFPQPAHAAALAFALFVVAAGAAGVRRLAHGRHVARMLRGRTSIRDDPAGADLADWVERLTGHRNVRITVCDALPGPVARGHREICLPRRMLSELGTAEKHAILAHEVAHLLRRDPLWLGTLDWMRTLLFIQPLNALALDGFKRSAEMLCDDWAVGATGRPIALARSITTVAGWVRATRPAPLPAMSEAGVSFVSRVERLVQYRTRATGRTRRAAGGLLLAGLIVALVPLAAPAVRVGAGRADAEVGAHRHRVIRYEARMPEDASGQAPFGRVLDRAGLPH